MENNRLRLASSIIVVLCIMGCSSPSSFLEGKKIDYKSAGKIQPLEIPPDLTAPTQDDRYAVPDTKAQGPATASVYNKERATTQSTGQGGILAGTEKVLMERSGSQRWLVIKADAQDVWPIVKDFWQELGFIIKIESPDTGIMETDWAENRAKIPQDVIRSFIGKLFDPLYSTPERDKFRTRLERGAASGTTEIYISHRGMIELYTREGQKETKWQPRPADPELEAEMLNRLAARFGAEEQRVQAQLQAPEQKAKLTQGTDGSSQLSLNEGFDRAWRRVGLALDRVGFTVEDRDRSKGLYFVRYIDPDEDNQVKPKGFLARIFGRDPKPLSKDEQYRIRLSDAGASTEILVQDKEGSAENSVAAGRILSLLYEQLK